SQPPGLPASRPHGLTACHGLPDARPSEPDGLPTIGLGRADPDRPVRGSTRPSAHPAVLGLHLPSDGLVDRLPAFRRGRAGTGVALSLGVRELAFELAMTRQPPRRQATVVEGGANRAFRLSLVTAVRKPAAQGEVGDVLEGGLDALLGA